MLTLVSSAWICSAETPVMRVIDRDTGRPIQGATVRLSQNKEVREYETGLEGEVKVTGLRPGFYRLEVEKAGYADPADPGSRGRTWRLAADGAGNAQHIGLARAAAISGQIMDERREPVSGMAVLALRRPSATGVLLPINLEEPAITDDLGRYRLYGLPPGEYSIVAIAAGEPAANRSAVQVFYPGEMDASRAAFVEVKSGSELNGIDFRVASPAAGFGSLAGVVKGISEQWPSQRVMLSLLPRSGVRVPLASKWTNDSGAFVFSDVSPGQYDLVAWGPPNPGPDFSTPPRGPDVRYAMATVFVEAGRRNDLTLELTPAVTVEVHLRSGAGVDRRCDAPLSLMIYIESVWPESWRFEGIPSQAGIVWNHLPAAAYRFEAAGLDRGCAFLGVLPAESQQQPPRKSMSIASPVTLSAVVRPWSGQLAVKVHGDGGVIKAGAVLLSSQDDQAFILSAKADGEGVFLFDRLAPAEYSLAWTESLRSGSRRSQRTVRLGEAQRLEVDLTVDKDKRE